jgi:hypothetical protein
MMDMSCKCGNHQTGMPGVLMVENQQVVVIVAASESELNQNRLQQSRAQGI